MARTIYMIKDLITGRFSNGKLWYTAFYDNPKWCKEWDDTQLSTLKRHLTAVRKKHERKVNRGSTDPYIYKNAVVIKFERNDKEVLVKPVDLFKDNKFETVMEIENVTKSK